MKKIKEKKVFLYNLLLLTVFFNIWFPKAGIKISGIPLTIGNLLFACTFAVWGYYKIKEKKMYNHKINIIIVLGILYFVIKYTIVYATGILTKDSIGYIIPLIIYPVIFFIVTDTVDSRNKMNIILKIIVYGFFFLSFYSLLQYIVGIDKCCIPGLTVNYTDYANLGRHWYLYKANGTSAESSKIVSTYQNGNLYGINTLLIYPFVYNYLKEKKSKVLWLSLVLFIVCVFLSLSRACWLGIVLFIFIEIILNNEKTRISMLKKIFIVVLCLLSVIIIFKYVPSISNRFFNTKTEDWISMSGRTEGLISVINTVNQSNSILAILLGPYGISDYSGLAYEMFPLAIFVQVGIIGIILLYLVFIQSITKMDKKNCIQKSSRLSILIWLIVGIIECAYWLPPVALNIFLVLALGYAEMNICKERKD